jgi:hypothetical protein
MPERVTRRPDQSVDPLALKRGRIAYHQSYTFQVEHETLSQALGESPLFVVERVDGGTRAQWVRQFAEDDISPFPYGLVSLGPRGALIEAFSDDRLRILRHRVNELGPWELTIDQVRVFAPADAVERPEALLQPLHEEAGLELQRREVAVRYLQLAWAFLPHERLAGRPPQLVVGTGRGRAALEEILDRIPGEIRETIPAFPHFDVDELREILLLAEAADEAAADETAGERKSRRT